MPNKAKPTKWASINSLLLPKNNSKKHIYPPLMLILTIKSTKLRLHH